MLMDSTKEQKMEAYVRITAELAVEDLVRDEPKWLHPKEVKDEIAVWVEDLNDEIFELVKTMLADKGIVVDD